MAWSAPATHAATLPTAAETRLYVSYSAKPDSQTVLAHNVCILDPAAEAPLAEGHATGSVFLAYVSTIEVAPDSPPAKSAKKRGIPVLGKNPGWNSGVLDITHKAWEDWLVEDIARPAIEKGYDGVFLDTLDSVMRITSERPTAGPACREALVRLIKRLDQEFPGKHIVLNRGFLLIEQVAESIDGVLVESVYQTFSPEKKAFESARVEGTEWVLSHITRIQEKKLPVYVVDYVPLADAALARKTAERIRELGCVPFVTTPDLQGDELAPLREVPRRIVVIHGGRQAADQRPFYPMDTFTAGVLQAPLEWLGCEVEFMDSAKGTPPDLSPLKYRGVLLDEELKVPSDREDDLAEWLLRQQRSGLKVLFTGSIPFTRQTVVRRVFNALSLAGSNLPLQFGKAPALKLARAGSADAATPSSLPVEGEYRAVDAPRGAKVLLTVQGADNRGRSRSTDAGFIADWGGALLLRGMPDHTLRSVDLHDFLKACLGIDQTFPVPDVTTRDGMRSFYALAGGDGFVTRSALEGHPLCSDVIRDRVLGAHPLPVTVSVIESEIESHVSGLDPLAAPQHREVARRIFALSNVQAASHSYSHPFRWLERDVTRGSKPAARNFPLKPWANYDENVRAEREVRGSIEYINRALLPPDKQVELMLWSGHGRPGAEALRLCRELAIEDMAAGAAVQFQHRSLPAGPSPRHAVWDDQRQIIATNSNELVCLSDRPGQLFGSFENVIAGFEQTGAPRRIAPVNVCFHFSSAMYRSSLNALEKIFAWCMDQPLHAVTARQQAQIMRDAGATRIYATSSDRWLIANAGHLRTFRLPGNALNPDIAASRGVTGWVRDGGSLYVHTRGWPVTELVLGTNPAPHLRLTQSSAEIAFRALAPTKAEFHVKDLRPVRAAFAGAPPNTMCDLLVNGQSMRLQSDEQGNISLNLPATAEVSLDFSTTRLVLRN